MTQQRKHILKTICAVVMILALPSLFFQYIGHNPMKVTDNATRTIAIVNEDLGVSGEEKEVRFGEEIPSVLKNNSDYNWTVLNRSAAVNGLEHLKYDAVIYIPSHFSENILTYDEQHPNRAQLSYEIQDQLKAVNKEKVLKELKSATNKVNNHLSSLYWSYVSQEMENVRDQFSNILDKEIAFQDAMFSFYNPSSEKLTEELTRQKELLKQLQDNIGKAENGASERKETVEQVENKLSHFVKYVDAYKAYQKNQKQFLQDLQGQSEEEIQNGFKVISENQKDLNQMVSEQTGQVEKEIAVIQGSLMKNQELVNEKQQKLKQQKTALKDYLAGQIAQYYDHQELTDLKDKMIPLKKTLHSSYGDSGTNLSIAATESQPSQTGSTKIEREQLKSIANSIDKRVAELENEIPKEERTQPVKDAIKNLPKLSSKTKTIINQLQTIEENDQQYHQKLNNDIQSLKAQLQKYKGLESSRQILIEQIDALEGQISKSPISSDDLNDVFNLEINSNDMSQIAKYHELLSQYQGLLTEQANTPGKETMMKGINQQVDAILSGKDGENTAFTALENDLNDTRKKTQTAKVNLKSLIKNYGKNVAKQQSTIMDNLTSIQQIAKSMESKLQQPADIGEGNSTPTNQAPDGTILLSLQKGMGQELQSMNKLMDSMGERQSNIVDYTAKLQNKVDSVQDQADTLNDKWAQNVNSTKQVKDHVYDILGNTMVDGQNNGYVYNYLSNPLAISGEAPEEKEKTVPPVVVMVIIMISSLLIGYFSHYYKNAPFLVRGSLFSLLNLIVGLMISVFGLNIYALADDRAIQWSIFTILLLVAGSLIVRGAFHLGSLIGWFTSVVLILFFITPLLDLAVPNFSYQDPVSKVYMSIQYDTNNLFMGAVIVLVAIILILAILPPIARLIKSDAAAESDHTHEA